MLGLSLQTDIIKDLAAKITNHMLRREEILLVSVFVSVQFRPEEL